MIAIPNRHLFIISSGTFLAAFSLASIMNVSDPNTARLSTFIFFYLSLALVTLGLATLVGLILRQKFLPGHYMLSLRASFRQGLFLAVLTTASLMLLAKDLMFWWLELTLILFFAALEALVSLKI